MENCIPPSIFIAPLPRFLRPLEAPFRYPSYSDDWGIEQDFLDFLQNHYPRVVSTMQEADFTYLPVFWTRYHLQHNFGRDGQSQLREAIGPVLQAPGRKFTVCQYADGPLVDLGDTTVFLGSRQTTVGTDAPLLTSPVPRPRFRPRISHLASFTGRVDTHPLRGELATRLSQRTDVFFGDKTVSARRYSKAMMSAEIALSPRGHGGSSFRFYEAIQLGVIPWLIGDIDVRPFKGSIDWDSCSLYSSDVESFLYDLDRIHGRDLRLLKKNLDRVGPQLQFGRWPKLLIEELSFGFSSDRKSEE